MFDDITPVDLAALSDDGLVVLFDRYITIMRGLQHGRLRLEAELDRRRAGAGD